MAAAEAAALALISWEDLRLMSGMQLLMLLLIKSLVVEVGGEFKAFNSFLWLINDFVLTRYSESETREKITVIHTKIVRPARSIVCSSIDLWT